LDATTPGGHVLLARMPRLPVPSGSAARTQLAAREVPTVSATDRREAEGAGISPLRGSGGRTRTCLRGVYRAVPGARATSGPLSAAGEVPRPRGEPWLLAVPQTQT